MPKRSTQNTSRAGVHAVGHKFEHDFAWYFREQHESDFGIDAQVETTDPQGKPCGKLLALQIKSGSSFFKRRGLDYVYYGERQHLDYWTRHCLPVYVVLHNPDDGTTLWQKVELRFITQTATGWSMSIPATNTLTPDFKDLIEAGAASDPEAVRRFTFASDMEWMERLQDKEVYFVFDIWVNKSWNIRRVKVYYDDYDKQEPDFEWQLLVVFGDVHDVMRTLFPWLDYEYADEIQDGSGEVEGHIFSVRLNKHAKRYLKLEKFLRDGPPERDDPDVILSEEEQFKRDVEEASYQDYLNDEWERHQEELKRINEPPPMQIKL